MARQTLDRNVKFKTLVRRLNLPRPFVRGLLEIMWDVAHECGNPVLGSPEEVEMAAEWPYPKRAGEFFAALRDVRLIDEAEPGKWVIHDYWDHAPKHVKNKKYMEEKRKSERRGGKVDNSDANGGSSTAKSGGENDNSSNKDLRADCGPQRETGGEKSPSPHTPHPSPNPPNPPEGGGEDQRTGQVEGDDPVGSQVRAYFAESTRLVWSPKAEGELRKLVDSAGWDGARTCIDEAIAYGARNPIAYAGTVWEGKQAQFRLRSEMKPKPTGTTGGPIVRRVDR